MMPKIPPPPFGAVFKGATSQILEQFMDVSGPSYKPSVFNPSSQVMKGPVRVAKNRVPPAKAGGEPGFDIYYEVHGKGSRRIALIMGLANSCFSWLEQVEEFGHDPACSVLVLDNRGYGNSDTPVQRYTTGDMAKDVIEVMDHIGWTEKQSVNLVGVSMGGMISLEIARQNPERLASLLLLSTTSGDGSSLPPPIGLVAMTKGFLASLTGRTREEARVSRMTNVLFPLPWQNEKHPTDPRGRTNGEVMREILLWRSKFVLPPTTLGPLLQMSACLTHHVSSKDLKRINELVPKIAIITGDWDQIVNPSHSKHMHKMMPDALYEVWKDAGHAIHIQFPFTFNKFLRQWIGLPPVHE